MDEVMKYQIERLSSGRRFCDRHPTITVVVMLFFVAVVLVTAVGALVCGFVGALRLLEIRSIGDGLLPRFKWWALLLLAGALSFVWRVAGAYGLALRKRWI
jgi:hypothetical protein